MIELSRAILPSKNQILYSPTETFPPTEGTIQTAHLAAGDLNAFCNSSMDLRNFNVLELGVGPGTFLVELASQLTTPERFNLFGIDIDPISVKLARFNLRKAAEVSNSRINFTIEEANWASIEFWQRLEKGSFHLVYFNPPYLLKTVEVPEKLTETPSRMIYGEGLGGLYHYRWVLPELPAILSSCVGSEIIFRMPEYLTDEELSSLEDGSLGRVLWLQTLQKIPNPKTVLYYNFEPGIKGHFCKIVKQ